MRLYNAESSKPIVGSEPKASPPRRDLPQSPTAFSRNLRHQKRTTGAQNADHSSRRRPTKITSAFFDPFEIDHQFQFSSDPFYKISDSRETSVTDKLTPVASSESYDRFAASDETDVFLSFPNPFATGQVDFQAPIEGNLFNDTSTWMTSSTLSTQFTNTNHEVNVSKTLSRAADDINRAFASSSDFGNDPIRRSGEYRPAHDKRPDEVFVRTPKPPHHYADLGTESFPLFTGASESASSSDNQWWKPRSGNEHESFDPFPISSTLHAFPLPKQQDGTDGFDKKNQPLQYLPQGYANAKANLRKVSRKDVHPTQVPSLVRKEEAEPRFHHSHKKDVSVLAPFQQSKYPSSSKRQNLPTVKELNATEAVAERSHAKGRIDHVLTEQSFMSVKGVQPAKHRRLESKGVGEALTDERDVSPSTEDDPPTSQRTGFISSAALKATRARLEKETSRPALKGSTDRKETSLPTAQLVGFVSSDALNSSQGRLGKTATQGSKAISPGAPGSFLAERVEAARPSAVLHSRADDVSPTRLSKSDITKESSPIAAKVKQVAQEKALQDMLMSMRFGKKEVSQSASVKLPESKKAPKPSDPSEATTGPESETAAQEPNGMLPLKDDPTYAKYFKMMKMGLPVGAVKNALERDGLDPSVLDGDHNSPAGQRPGEGVPLNEDPKYAKYFKMMKMGLPMGAVKQAMERDGLEPSVLDGDHNAPAGQQPGEGVPLKDDPKFAKYMKMMKMGLPMGAVKQAMERDGLDPSVLDGDLSSPVGGAKGTKRVVSMAPVPQDKYRRTRVHWETHNTVRSNTVWAMVRRDPDVAELNVDEEEFSSLFQAESKPSQQSPPPPSTGATEKGIVKIIDKKRANNGGITLARIKLTYEEIACAVDCYDETALSQEHIRGILQYLPTAEETTALRSYLGGGSSADSLCECEKFMVAIMTVKHAKRKLDAILYIQKFTSSLEELRRDSRLVQKACDEIMASSRLRKILGIVLHLGNRLNTAGPVMKDPADAFKLESLLKLNQPRAFDKKTTFLQYIVGVVRRNSASLCHFKDDLSTVLVAEKIVWESTLAELKRMENELESVRRLALYHALERDNTQTSTRGSVNGDSVAAMSIPSKISLKEEFALLGKTSIGNFTLDACSRMAAVVEEVNNAKTSYNALLLYFGEEDNTSAQPNDVFQIISAFSRDFEAALCVVAETEKVQLREEKRQSRKRAPILPSASDDSEGSESSGSLRKRVSSAGMGGVLNELRKPNLKWRRRKHVS